MNTRTPLPDTQKMIERARRERSHALGLFIVRLPGRVLKYAGERVGALFGRPDTKAVQ